MVSNFKDHEKEGTIHEKESSNRSYVTSKVDFDAQMGFEPGESEQKLIQRFHDHRVIFQEAK